MPLVNSPKKLRKRATLLFGIGLIGTCFLYYASEQFSVRGKPLEQVGEIPVDVCIPSNETNSHDIPKTILFWTTFYGEHVWNKLKMDLNEECPNHNCRLTTDRRLLNESDAVIFHFWQDKLDRIPTCRRPDQYYVYLNFESAIRSRSYFPWRKIPRDFFNLTATYRLDSDFFGKMFYGFQFDRLESIQPTSVDLTNYYGVNITAKTKLAAWFVSNCQTSVNREGYVRELRRHIPVDVFGKCLENHKSCPRKKDANNQSLYYVKTECDEALERDYLFYLSFENSFCPDYVTEKFYRAVEMGTVPVVFGGANYSLFAPPHSFINARDFQTPKLLAEYLVKLSENLDLYSKYFDWRGEFNLKRGSGWCKLCEMLNDSVAERKSYPVIEEWFFDRKPCENFHWTNNTIN
ncbi:alpha-(1,3)-fucosyltransferase C-like isoform X1 [Daphnia pulex]|uniref:alpha-(1,3)-fucosyltransferase C-like isoform X1 n=2 Tax=Daphnia pulex TaxID=6669 RepID=UPI001EDEDB59|nr:alpha-(1,3)-fucosyltransferase C-like isoform X1 [Daphnia pulex]